MKNLLRHVVKKEAYMSKKRITLLLMLIMLCTACQSPEQEVDETEDVGKNIDLRQEINTVLENASYENLEIQFDEMKYYEGQALEIANIRDVYPDENLTYEETLQLYVDKVFPSLLDMEKIDMSFVYDGDTSIKKDEKSIDIYEKNYEAVLATLDSYEIIPRLVYQDEKNWKGMCYTANWMGGVYITNGVLGSYAETMNPFSTYNVIEKEKTYDCRFDDLSDTYMLMDGEKSVAEAKEEMEAYLDARYPITGENGILNEVYQISVGKIRDTEYYAFTAYRTFSYNGIPFREMPDDQGIGLMVENAIMAECALCESDKVDVTIGPINVYSEPEVERVISEVIPFQEVMDRVAYYLTGETKFQLIYGGVEYRMFITGAHKKQLVPQWVFLGKNPNDDKIIKMYVDMETGEITHSGY